MSESENEENQNNKIFDEESTVDNFNENLNFISEFNSFNEDDDKLDRYYNEDDTENIKQILNKSEINEIDNEGSDEFYLENNNIPLINNESNNYPEIDNVSLKLTDSLSNTIPNERKNDIIRESLTNNYIQPLQPTQLQQPTQSYRNQSYQNYSNQQPYDPFFESPQGMIDYPPNNNNTNKIEKLEFKNRDQKLYISEYEIGNREKINDLKYELLEEYMDYIETDKEHYTFKNDGIDKTLSPQSPLGQLQKAIIQIRSKLDKTIWVDMMMLIIQIISNFLEKFIDWIQIPSISLKGWGEEINKTGFKERLKPILLKIYRSRKSYSESIGNPWIGLFTTYTQQAVKYGYKQSFQINENTNFNNLIDDIDIEKDIQEELSSIDIIKDQDKKNNDLDINKNDEKFYVL